jgi:hypothetical protein
LLGGSWGFLSADAGVCCFGTLPGGGTSSGGSFGSVSRAVMYALVKSSALPLSRCTTVVLPSTASSSTSWSARSRAAMMPGARAVSSLPRPLTVMAQSASSWTYVAVIASTICLTPLCLTSILTQP